jgi:hypothetical protein
MGYCQKSVYFTPKVKKLPSCRCGRICNDNSWLFLLRCSHILWISGTVELWKDLQRRQIRFSSSLSVYIIWISGYHTPWKVFQRRQLRFSSSLSTYSLDQRLPYTVKGFEKTTGKIFFFVIHIFFGSGVTVHWKDLQRRWLWFLVLYLQILWISGYRILWKNLQRQQLRFTSSLSTYFLDERLPYTVEGFAKTTAEVFFFFIL